ncbi:MULTISPECIES: BrnA antitoxin family protein [Methylomonas]|uniref:BrnA antitoxin family protein n=1 Tax=Methylomonas TaxID=416 RepID=UPI001231B093|nr:BrnA antitoxin family protein [Methylomonas rhizoryzae]
MNAKSTNIGSDLSKVDAHDITAEEYEEIPELTDEFFEHADLYEGEKLIRAGRPKAERPKVLLTVRYSPEVVEAFKATGKGWQTRMDDALKEWLREHPASV